jgi:hypothetical protein
MSAFKDQVGGDHYRMRAIQPLEYTLANNLNFCQGNVIKYVTRYKTKGGREDLLKARHYIDLLLESEYKEEVTEAKYEGVAQAYPAEQYVIEGLTGSMGKFIPAKNDR